MREHKVYKVRDFNIPRLIAFDDVLQIIEMSWLSPPFLVDFGGAYVDKAPEHLFDPELREEWLAKGAEEFGENWGVVLAILADLETMYGIYLADINTRNIQF